MRTVPAAVLTLGMVLSIAFVATPATAGCSSLAGDPDGCATSIYNSAKGNAQATILRTQVWGSVFPAYAAACPGLPTIGIILPGVPDADAVQVFVSDLNTAADRFQAGAAVNLFPATAFFISDGFNATADVLIAYSDTIDSLIRESVPETLEIGPPEVPEPPDVEGGAEAVAAYLAENAGSLQQGIDQTATCLQNAPAP